MAEGRLTELDASFLHLENGGAHMHVAGVVLFDGGPPRYDDPHLNLRYHIRRTSLPPPGREEQLRALAGRVFSQPLDRDKPLWEMWLVEGLEQGEGGNPRFAMLSKTHHALVDGI